MTIRSETNSCDYNNRKFKVSIKSNNNCVWKDNTSTTKVEIVLIYLSYSKNDASVPSSDNYVGEMNISAYAPVSNETIIKYLNDTAQNVWLTKLNNFTLYKKYSNVNIVLDETSANLQSKTFIIKTYPKLRYLWSDDTYG